jgi:hypothetical protein
VFGYDTVEFGTIEHIDDFEVVSDLHCGRIFITVDSNNRLSDALGGDDKFFA